MDSFLTIQVRISCDDQQAHDIAREEIVRALDGCVSGNSPQAFPVNVSIDVEARDDAAVAIPPPTP